MKSRMSFCNGGLLRRNLSRTVLLWGAYLVLWLVLFPGNLISLPAHMHILEVKRRVLLVAANACHLVSFFYGMAMAWFLFLHLHRSRSANFYSALPLRRETMFLTQYLTGLLCAAVPNFIIMGAVMLSGAANGVSLVMESAIWFAANTMVYVFYFSLAALCSMVVGNLVAMPLLYGVLNFVAVVVESLIRVLLESVLYGIYFNGRMVMGPFSPFYHAVLDGKGPDCRVHWEGNMLTEVEFTGWSGIWILFAVGLVFAAAAFFFHKYRALEVAGDVMAIKKLKPVFLYMFTFGFGLVAGTLVAEILTAEMNSSYFTTILISMTVCTAVGYFLGQMILLRTVRVFRKRSVLRGGICAALTLVLLMGLRMDVLGVERYVPNFEDVAAVRLQSGVHNVEDPVRIQQVLDLHQEIILRQDETEALCRENSWNPSHQIVYVLKDGSEVFRRYNLPVSEYTPAEPDSLVYQYEEINNTAEMILSRELPVKEMIAQNVDDCTIQYYLHNYSVGDSIHLSRTDAIDLWNNAILQDLKAGNLGQVHRSAQMVMKDPVPVETYIDVSVSYDLFDGENSEHAYFNITPEAVHTVRALLELGVPEEAFTGGKAPDQ